MYPASEGDSNGIFIKRMVDDLERRNVEVLKAVKTTRSPFGYVPFYFDSLKLVLREDVDILQAHYIPHSSIIPSLFKMKKPLVLKFHGDDARIFPYKNSIYRAVTRYMLRKSDHVITVSEDLKMHLINLGADPSRVSTIASGVDTGIFRHMDKHKCRTSFNLPLETPIFIFIGRLHPWKGITEIIEVARQHPDSIFLFVGPGRIPAHPDNCIFTGPVPPHKIPQLLNTADCALLPSYTEGLPNLLVESLASEVPAIASDVGGCPEVIRHGETGLIISPRNVKALSDAVQWMKVHPDEREEMGRLGRADMIKRYEHQTLTDRLIQIHIDLIEG